MMSEPALLFAVVAVRRRRSPGRDRRVVAPFPDRSSAAAYALDNDLRHFAVGPMAFAVPTTSRSGCPLARQGYSRGESASTSSGTGASASASTGRELPSPRPATS